MKNHEYHTKLTWTGNLGEGTKSYNSCSRAYSIDIENKMSINNGVF